MIPHLQWTSDRTIRGTFGGVLPLSVRAALAEPDACTTFDVTDIAFTTHAVQFTVVGAFRVSRSRRLEDLSEKLIAIGTETAHTPATSERIIPVCFEGDFAPDLAEIAGSLGIAPAEFIRRMVSTTFTAEFLGFSPGFAYLSGLPAELHVPRRAKPRPRIEPGTLAIAADRCAVYPSATPGGWNLVGRTPQRIFDPGVAELRPVIRPLDRVRFTSISAAEFKSHQATPLASPLAASPTSIRVLNPGAFASVQDLGRKGLGTLGIPCGGAADRVSFLRANLQLMNPSTAAGIEFVGAGFSFEAMDAVTVAMLGPSMTHAIHRSSGVVERTLNGVFTLRTGDRVVVESMAKGCCGYAAFGGGIDVPLVAGSRSTHAASGMGGFRGRALAAGDCLAVLPGSFHELPAANWDAPDRNVLRFTRGLHATELGEACLEAFRATIYQVDGRSSRSGIRLAGPAIPHDLGSLPTEPTTWGAVQLPPDGLPIILGPDGPVTGGYPVIGVLALRDLHHAAQLRTGAYVRFEEISVEDSWGLTAENDP